MPVWFPLPAHLKRDPARMAKSVDARDLKSVLSSPFCFCHQAGRSIVARTWEHPRRSFAARLDGQEPTRSQQGEV
ncbi:hypothetical protein PANN_27160 [Pseudomonas aeruginosa C-NN2]|nr:hypothetical protein PANN_27160 [Pseudomonas aeruginosa C-NN2]